MKRQRAQQIEKKKGKRKWKHNLYASFLMVLKTKKRKRKKKGRKKKMTRKKLDEEEEDEEEDDDDEVEGTATFAFLAGFVLGEVAFRFLFPSAAARLDAPGGGAGPGSRGLILAQLMKQRGPNVKEPT